MTNTLNSDSEVSAGEASTTPPPEEPDHCQSCIGTGIGNPRVERSVCSTCNGSGTNRPVRQFQDEERWAFNHFEPEPGDDE